MIISKISDIYNKYSKVLRDTQKYINNIRDKQSQILVDNINEFKKFIIDYSKILNSSVYIKNIINFIKSFFGSGMQHIPLIAIDGSSGKEKLEDCIIFYSLAYGISGEILIQHDSVKFSYPTSPLQPSDPNSLNSIVAYVPVPYSEILSENESFDDVSYIVLSDYEKFDMSILNLELMKLAEIYLSYKSTNNYKIILIDYLLSSLLMHSEIHWENIGLINGEFRGITGLSITPAHIAITKAHPFYLESDYLINQFKVPACTKFRLFSRLIADLVYYFDDDTDYVSWNELSKVDNELDVGLLKENLKRQSKLISNILGWDNSGVYIGGKDTDGSGRETVRWFKRLWNETKRFFETFCEELFEKQNIEVLRYLKEYKTKDNSIIKAWSWITPNDILFLLEVGIKALIEKAWEKRILLIGVAKDSSAKYLTRNLMSILKYKNINIINRDLYEKILKYTPTDRKFVEVIALHCEDFKKAPISSIEYDSVFSTLRAGYIDDLEGICLRGVRGEILNQNLLFAKSIAIFYIDKKSYEKEKITSHAIFVERLIYPNELRDMSKVKTLTSSVDNSESDCQDYDRLGKIDVFLPIENYIPSENKYHAMTILILNSLVQNKYPDAIGYPDILHEAHLYAQELGNSLRNIIKTSKDLDSCNYLNVTFREYRDIGVFSRREGGAEHET